MRAWFSRQKTCHRHQDVSWNRTSVVSCVAPGLDPRGLCVTTCNHRRPGPQSSVGICPHSVRLSAGPNPQSVRPSPHCVRRTRNHRVGTEIRETENFASLPWRVRISTVFLAIDFQGPGRGNGQPETRSEISVRFPPMHHLSDRLASVRPGY
jgi:hypothetical protein